MLHPSLTAHWAGKDRADTASKSPPKPPSSLLLALFLLQKAEGEDKAERSLRCDSRSVSYHLHYQIVTVEFWRKLNHKNRALLNAVLFNGDIKYFFRRRELESAPLV